MTVVGRVSLLSKRFGGTRDGPQDEVEVCGERREDKEVLGRLLSSNDPNNWIIPKMVATTMKKNATHAPRFNLNLLMMVT